MHNNADYAQELEPVIREERGGPVNTYPTETKATRIKENEI